MSIRRPRESRRPRLPMAWSPYLRRPRMPGVELRLTVWVGLTFGLLAAQALRWESASLPVAPPPVLAPPGNPFAEAGRPRQILAELKGAAAPLFHEEGSVAAPLAGIRVIDGDTFDYGGERIRIVGIDTPETHPARCAAEAELGEQATRRLIALLAAGPFELVPIDRDEDRYGRKLRHVMRDGRDLGQMLVAEGLARPYGGGRRGGWCG